MSIFRYALVLAAAAALAAASGCAKEESPQYPDGGGGAKLGDPCVQSSDCDLTLVCAGDSTCQKPGSPGTGILGEGCGFNTDCQIKYVCASYGKCVEPGSGKEGDACAGNEICGAGLLCSATKACAKPGSAGTKRPKDKCDNALDCAFGLVCVAESCQPVTYWAGVTCAKDSGPLRSYFEVPRSGKKVMEFYRLPFPNDIRLKNGKVDVSDHPNPSTALPKEYGDVVGDYYKAIGEDVTGFGLNAAAFFRLSKAFDLNTISVEIVNIDKASPDYARKGGYNMWATTGRGKYICDNHIAVRPTNGKPLNHKTTYAVLLKQGIKDSTGALAAQDADFKAMLASAAPSDSGLSAAYSAYQPLRDYITDKALKSDDILNAAVFTTMDPRAKMARFRAVIHASAAPSAGQLTLCDGMKKSPCENASEPKHVCASSPAAAFDELQGTYGTPNFQTGTKPFKTTADGGAIAYSAGGDPVIQGQETACFALSVPKGATMPPAGWPLVIFAHGTGGNYRGFIGGGTAEALASVKDASGTVANMAVIGIDGAMHGPRRNSSDKPDDLFFNLQNPRAARDNTYQGAADKFQLVRLVKAMNLDDASSPTGAAIKFDPTKIYYFGHSQGSIEGIPFLAYEPDVAGTVLSGAGGYLLGSLLWKTKPVNVAGLVQLALADNSVTTSHPLLNLMQLFFEEVDSINYGDAIFNKPVTGIDAKHTFLSYGIADSYTPPNTINALGWAMSIRQTNQSAQRCGDGVCNGSESCKSCSSDCGACPAGTTCGNSVCEQKEKCSICPEDCKECPALFATDDPPVKENYDTGGKKFTVGLVQYSSDGSYDDHFVLFQNKDGKTQSTNFLGTAARDGAPTILKVK